MLHCWQIRFICKLTNTLKIFIRVFSESFVSMSFILVAVNGDGLEKCICSGSGISQWLTI